MSIRGQFSSLDTFQVVQEINKSIAHHRMNNFYDVGPKTFVMRFGAAESKHRIAFEPGIRCHLTDVDHEKPKIPSYFTLMIRKHIKGWRIHSVKQVGRDRVIDFAFGRTDDPPQFHMFLELWGQGNIILTDGETKIISMWRTIKTNSDKKSGKDEKNNNNTPAASVSPSSIKQIGDLYLSPQEEEKVSGFVQVTKETLTSDFSNANNQNVPLNSLLPVAVYGPQLMKHISLSSGIDFSKSIQKLSNNNVSEEFISTLATKISNGFSEVDNAYDLFSSSSSSSSSNNNANNGGFAFSDIKQNNNNNNNSGIQQYLSFAKLPLKQFASNPANFSVTPTPTFSAAADLLFSAEERKKLADIAKKQPTAQSREERCRAAIQRRIVELENEGAQRRKCANALVLASDEVDKIVQLVSDALALGTNWKTLTEAIRRQREAAAEEDAKRIMKAKKQKESGSTSGQQQQNNNANDDEDDDDDKIDLGSSDDDEDEDDSDNGEDLFLESDEDEDDENDDDDDDDEDSDDDEDEDDERSEQERAADEQRYLLSLIYALDLRKNQMTLQLPDPDHSFGDDDEEEENEEQDQDFRLGGPKLVLVVVDIGLTAHENATKYFELAKKADRSKAKTEDKEEEAVARAKQSGSGNSNNSKKNKNNNNKNENSSQNEANKKKNAAKLPKQITSSEGERQPAWFERHYWFITSVGDLVVIPKDAGQADVLIQKFANKNQDLVVMVDQFGSWPTLVKPRKGMVLAASSASSSEENSSNETTTFKISNTSLLEAAAATLCRSNTSCWVSQASLAKQLTNNNNKQKNAKNNNSNASPVTASIGSASCFWCPVSSLTKTPDQGSGIKQFPQGAWNVMNAKEFKKPLQLAFSAQLCVAMVEATAGVVKKFNEEETSADSDSNFVNVSEVSAKASSAVSNNDSGMMDRQNSVASSIATTVNTNSTNKKPHQQQNETNNQQELSQKALQRQHKKAKLIQKKYGEQDDDDRAIALALIGTKKSKAQEKLEQEDQLPTASSVEKSSSKKDKKDKKDKKSKKKKGGDAEEDDDDEEGLNQNNEEQHKKQQQEEAEKQKKKEQEEEKKKQQKQQQQQQPRQLSDEAQKNLQEKIQSAASEFLTMKYVSAATTAASTSSSTSSTRYLLPVLVPLLTMPMNKCRVLMVPGGEKRSELAKELNSSFFVALGNHLGKVFENFPSLVSKMQNDDILLQLPPTAKIQTPFRASLVPLPSDQK